MDEERTDAAEEEIEAKLPEYKAIQITNPYYIGTIGPFINEFVNRLNVPNITYESLHAYFTSIVESGHLNSQRGTRDTSEFWVVLEDDVKPIAFANWHVCGFPVLGSVACDFVYSWQTKKIPLGLLCDEFIRFGAEMRAKYYSFDAVNKRVYDVLKNALEKRNIEVTKTGFVHSICKRK